MWFSGHTFSSPLFPILTNGIISNESQINLKTYRSITESISSITDKLASETEL